MFEEAKAQKDFSARFVQNLLRTGLAVAMVLMLAGLLIKFLHGDFQNPGFRLDQLFTSMSLGDHLILWGAFALALTPALRVLSLLVLWFLERDWVFTGVALGVLAVLSCAVLLGGG